MIKNIAIIGDGIPFFLTVLYVEKMTRGLPYKIHAHEGTHNTGITENNSAHLSLMPDVRNFHKYLEFSESEFFSKAQPGFSLGQEYIGWSKQPYHLSFSNKAFQLLGQEIHTVFQNLTNNTSGLSFDQLCIGGHLSKLGRFTPPSDIKNSLFYSIDYGYGVRSDLYLTYLQKKLVQKATTANLDYQTSSEQFAALSNGHDLVIDVRTNTTKVNERTDQANAYRHSCFFNASLNLSSTRIIQTGQLVIKLVSTGDSTGVSVYSNQATLSENDCDAISKALPEFERNALIKILKAAQVEAINLSPDAPPLWCNNIIDLKPLTSLSSGLYFDTFWPLRLALNELKKHWPNKLPSSSLAAHFKGVLTEYIEELNAVERLHLQACFDTNINEKRNTSSMNRLVSLYQETGRLPQVALRSLEGDKLFSLFQALGFKQKKSAYYKLSIDKNALVKELSAVSNSFKEAAKKAPTIESYLQQLKPKSVENKL